MTATSQTAHAPGTLIACPCCGRTVKITKTGKIARHGFNSDRGFQSSHGMMRAQCQGSNARPDRALAKALEIAQYYLDSEIAHCERHGLPAGSSYMKDREAEVTYWTKRIAAAA